MEVVIYLTKLFGEHWLVLAVSWVGGSVLGTLGTLVLGRGYKQRSEARTSIPATSQTFIYNAGADAQDHDRQLRDAIEKKTTQNLKETINSLLSIRLAEGHTYATLPNRTNIVTMADGSIRLALPVRLSAAGSVGIAVSSSAVVLKVSPPERRKPDDLGAENVGSQGSDVK